jgi:hypothetical protein
MNQEERTRKGLPPYEKPALPLDWKTDVRPQRFGWAPGDYIGRCCECHDAFIGDKRAIMCADCAYAIPDPRPVPYMWGDLSAFGVKHEGEE